MLSSRLLVLLLCAALGLSLHVNDGNFSEPDLMNPEPFQRPQQVAAGSAFNLMVEVSDALTRQPLSWADVQVYINHSVAHAAQTGERGAVLLHVPYQTVAPVTLAASKSGYISTMLPYRTSRIPIFSSVTLSLLAMKQGNIWIFEDSVLITGKTSDPSSRPIIQFPKSLLNLTNDSYITSVRAYLTLPPLPSEEDPSLNTVGIMSSKSGYVSVPLSPVAAVSVQLFLGDEELHVNGPVNISLDVPDSYGLQTSSVVPAWFFNQTTGAWMRKGLGTLASVEGKVVWTFTAPHLGYWIAAPMSSSRGFSGLSVLFDFILQHSFVLMLIVGAVLVIVLCMLVGLLLSSRCSRSKTKMKKKAAAAMRKDQTTSTCDDQLSEVSSGGSTHAQDGLNQSFRERGDNQRNASTQGGDVISNPGAVSIAVDCSELELNDLTCLHKTAEQLRLPAENLFFYNQPVAILHAPAFFHVEEQPEQWSRSATLPRAANSEPISKETFTQTQAKGGSTQEEEAEGQLGPSEADSQAVASRVHIPESVSVPGKLNRMGSSRHSVHALSELSRIPALQPPRAWFVSLEGKPAAEIHYAVSEQQRRRRPAESRETSLDSGVDMSELNQTAGRRTVTLERNATFVKSTSGSKNTPAQ